MPRTSPYLESVALLPEDAPEGVWFQIPVPTGRHHFQQNLSARLYAQGLQSRIVRPATPEEVNQYLVNPRPGADYVITEVRRKPTTTILSPAALTPTPRP